ncbi:unnamed protein product, partial [Larinioides sclopetarius]
MRYGLKVRNSLDTYSRSITPGWRAHARCRLSFRLTSFVFRCCENDGSSYL